MIINNLSKLEYNSQNTFYLK